MTDSLVSENVEDRAVSTGIPDLFLSTSLINLPTQYCVMAIFLITKQTTLAGSWVTLLPPPIFLLIIDLP